MQIENIEKLVGNTPLCKLTCKYNGKVKNVFAKLEWYNLSGSIKDRIALYIIKKSYEKKLLRKGQDIVEVTSGNTGIAFSAIGGMLGHKVTILMPEYMSDERKSLLRSYGANLVLLKREEGGFLKGLELAKTFEGAFLPLQFENDLNRLCHYETTGVEIVKKLKEKNIYPQAFICGVGTAGTLVGIGYKLKQEYKVSVFALEPAYSPTLKTGHKIGKHKIEGISDDFVPKIFRRSLVSDIVDITDEEAIFFAQKLAKIGLGVGISSGANLCGALKLEQDNVVTIFADDNKKYLSTDLFKKVSLDVDFEVLKIEIL